MTSFLTLVSLGITPLTALAASGSFTNPLGSASLSTIITSLINFLLGLSAMIAMLVLIWGGIRFITAGGNEQQLQSAKTTILWTVVGILVILTSFTILNTVMSVITGSM